MALLGLSKNKQGLPISSVTLSLVLVFCISNYDTHTYTPLAKNWKVSVQNVHCFAKLCRWNLISLVDLPMGNKNNVRLYFGLIFAVESVDRVKRHTQKMVVRSVHLI